LGRKSQIQRVEKNTNGNKNTGTGGLFAAVVQAFWNRIKGHHLSDGAFFFLALVVFAFDQFSKLWVVRSFIPGETLPLIPDVFHITYVRNPGAAFGIFAHHTPVFIAVSLFMVVIIILGGRFLSGRYFLIRLALALQLGGALGNLSDRLRTGSVIDFIDFRFWPVFNLADIALVIGIALLIFSMIYHKTYFFENNGRA
jgi:signal peptidase II